MKVAMLLNDDSGNRDFSRNVRSVSQITRWLDDLVDDY
jgi:hypothetical protein